MLGWLSEADTGRATGEEIGVDADMDVGTDEGMDAGTEAGVVFGLDVFFFFRFIVGELAADLAPRCFFEGGSFKSMLPRLILLMASERVGVDAVELAGWGS